MLKLNQYTSVAENRSPPFWGHPQGTCPTPAVLPRWLHAWGPQRPGVPSTHPALTPGPALTFMTLLQLCCPRFLFCFLTCKSRPNSFTFLLPLLNIDGMALRPCAVQAARLGGPEGQPPLNFVSGMEPPGRPLPFDPRAAEEQICRFPSRTALVSSTSDLSWRCRRMIRRCGCGIQAAWKVIEGLAAASREVNTVSRPGARRRWRAHCWASGVSRTCTLQLIVGPRMQLLGVPVPPRTESSTQFPTARGSASVFASLDGNLPEGKTQLLPPRSPKGMRALAGSPGGRLAPSPSGSHTHVCLCTSLQRKDQRAGGQWGCWVWGKGPWGPESKRRESPAGAAVPATAGAGPRVASPPPAPPGHPHRTGLFKAVCRLRSGAPGPVCRRQLAHPSEGGLRCPPNLGWAVRQPGRVPTGPSGPWPFIFI